MPSHLQPLLCLHCTISLEWTCKRPQFAHPLNPPLNFTYLPLALSSATFHSRLKTELFKLSYPDSTPASIIITDCNHSPTLSPQLDLSGFWPGTEMKREVLLLHTWFGIAPVNKLVSLTWLLRALRSFWRFTLHYIISDFKCEGAIFSAWTIFSNNETNLILFSLNVCVFFVDLVFGCVECS